MVYKTGTFNSEVITGTDEVDVLDGLAGNDELFAWAGNDVLQGGSGDDYMVGSFGDDEYYVDSVNDRVIENSNEGIDRITSQVTFNLELAPNVEELILAGTANIDGKGNSLDNWIIGNEGNNNLEGAAGNDSLIGGAGADNLVGGAGNDTLTGGIGADRLTGGAGADRFFFTDPLEGADRITDFTKQQGDKILLSSETFAVKVLTPRNSSLSDPIQLDSRLFVLGNRAQDSNDRLIYNKTNGKLFYDADGTGSMAKVHLATFENKPTLGAGDFAYVVV